MYNIIATKIEERLSAVGFVNVTNAPTDTCVCLYMYIST